MKREDSRPLPADEGPRPGEIVAPCDPAHLPPDAGVVFIGRVRTPWTDRATCPKNPREAGDARATIEIDEPWRPALAGLRLVIGLDGPGADPAHVIVLTWMNRAHRDLLVQAPRHAQEPRGTFALRSPARPNPIGLVVARVIAIDEPAGRVTVIGMDCLDGTPLVDLKPYIPRIDAKTSA